jgi:hypothetical protein
MGNPFKSNPERGVYRPKMVHTWQLVLSKDENGRLCSYRSYNPRIVYATLWEGYRNGHSMSSGGKGSGTNRSMAVILGNRLTRNQECQLES